jgi:hypothetical protein
MVKRGKMKFMLYVYIIIAIGSFIFSSYMHEQTHVAILAQDGIKSHVEYFSHFPDLATIPEAPCKTETCLLANEMNEVVSYNLMPFFMILLFGFLGIMVYLQYLCDLKEYELGIIERRKK